MDFVTFCIKHHLDNDALVKLLGVSVSTASKVRRGLVSLSLVNARLVYKKYEVVIYPFSKEALKGTKNV